MRINFHASLLLVEDALRAEETTSRLNLLTELSTLGKNTMIMADGSTLVTIPIDPNYLHVQDVAHETAKEILPPETSHISEAGTSKEFVLSTTIHRNQLYIYISY